MAWDDSQSNWMDTFLNSEIKCWKSKHSNWETRECVMQSSPSLLVFVANWAWNWLQCISTKPLTWHALSFYLCHVDCSVRQTKLNLSVCCCTEPSGIQYAWECIGTNNAQQIFIFMSFCHIVWRLKKLYLVPRTELYPRCVCV